MLIKNHMKFKQKWEKLTSTENRENFYRKNTKKKKTKREKKNPEENYYTVFEDWFYGVFSDCSLSILWTPMKCKTFLL